VTLDLPTLNLVAGIIVSVLTSLSLIGGLIWRIGRQVDAKFERLEADCMKIEKEQALALAAADARAKMAEDDLRRTIAEHKLFAAEHFATEDGVSKALEPVLKAIDRLADRLDRYLSGEAPTRQSPPRAR
jgi:hypothetical protein